MFRGYRRVIISLGLILLAVSPSWERGNAQQTKSESEISTSPKRVAEAVDKGNEPKREATDCREGRDGRKSDLCAQWKAADAAKQAADAADATVTIGWVGVALGAVTMGAAIAAAVFAWRAVNETRRIGEAQVRAYLTFEKVECGLVDGGMAFRCTVRNSGNSPALAAQVVVTVIDDDGSKIRIDPPIEHTVPAQGLEEFAECYHLGKAPKKSGSFLIYVEVGFADVFGSLEKFGEYYGASVSAVSDEFILMMSGKRLRSYLVAVGQNPPPRTQRRKRPKRGLQDDGDS